MVRYRQRGHRCGPAVADSLIPGNRTGRLKFESQNFGEASLITMARTQCTDRVVGAILASWRYDISGISPEMRRDYEQHLTECAHCRGRQKFHRSLDGTLAVLTALSMISFLFALAVLQRVKFMEHVAFNILGLDKVSMYQMLVSAAFAGLCFSLVAFVLVLITTPATAYLGGMAADRARLIEARLPEAIRSLRPR